jgi:hypothetical protein
MLPIIKWDIYEISSKLTPITGVMLRGRIRKLCIENRRNVLVENTEDIEKRVRFAVPSGENISIISEYLIKIIPDIKIEQVGRDIPNPVLSKLKLNIEKRYDL